MIGWQFRRCAVLRGVRLSLLRMEGRQDEGHIFCDVLSDKLQEICCVERWLADHAKAGGKATSHGHSCCAHPCNRLKEHPCNAALQRSLATD
eukprot:1159439-Pelagomonas_calceolata.AAC.9